MKKQIFSIFLLIFFSALIPLTVLGFTVSEITMHTVPEAYFYKQEFDKLILDAIIPSGNAEASDILNIFTIKTGGTVKRNEDFTKIVLWSDKGEVGFQGMGIDQKIGGMEYVYDLAAWRIKDLNVEIPKDGLRIFVSADIKKDMTAGRFFKAEIPAFLDQNYNGVYNQEDLGIFLQSSNNGPTDNVLTNFYSQTVRIFPNAIDNLPPKTVITNLENNSSVATTSLEIKGLVRDQGGSSMQWVKIGIKLGAGAELWYEAELGELSGDEQNWQYNWQNIAPGAYTLRTQSIDWRYNQGISEQELTMTIFEEVAEESEPEPESTTTSTSSGSPRPEVEPEDEVCPRVEDVASSTDVDTQELKEQIKVIQQTIIALLQQLLEVLREQLGL